MAMLDEDGYFMRCDRCKSVYSPDDKNFDFYVFVREIFFKRHKPDLGDFCNPCQKKIAPMVPVVRDVDELKLFVNNLERAINEKRKQRT